MSERDPIASFLARRAGKLTASRMNDALDFRKDGKPGAARTQYAREIIAERLVDATARHYVSPAMEHGILFEGDAKRAYEARTGNLITDAATRAECGVFDHPTIENFAASPDGLLDTDGLIETKCPTTATYMAWVLAGVVPEEHKAQMIAQCSCTGRRWVEFVAYDPRIREQEKQLFIRRYVPTPEEIKTIEDGARKFLDEVEAMWEAFVTAPMEAT